MTKETNRLQFLLYGITIVLALLILIDFTLPGNVFIEGDVNIKKDRENYYNAGGNSHNTYKVITPNHQFSVSENFAKSVQDKKIKYSVSLIFKEINRYQLFPSGKNEIYSFRIASGLALPLIVIFTIMIAYFYKKNIDILIFVLQVVLLGDFLMLIG